MLIILLLLTQQLQPVEIESPRATLKATLSQSGEVLAMVGNQLFHWNNNGDLIFKLDCDNELETAYFFGDLYWINALKVKMDHRGFSYHLGYSMFYDKSGKFIHEHKAYAPYVNLVDGRLFAPLGVFTKHSRLQQDYYPFLAKQISPELKNGLWDIQEGNIRFVRFPEIFRDHKLNWKRIWIATDKLILTNCEDYLEEGGHFLVMNVLEPKIYRYGKEEIKNQQLFWDAAIPYIELDLPDYVNPPEKTYTTTHPMLYKDYAQAIRNELSRWSRILWFGKYKDAYAVAYTLSGKNPNEPPLRIATLNRQFKVMNSITLEGGKNLLGTFDSEFYAIKEKREGNQLKIELEKCSVPSR